MGSTAVKLKPETYAKVKQLAKESQATMQDIVAEGIEALERARFAREFMEDFAALRKDTNAWAEEPKERELWDTTLADGLDE